MLSMFRNVLFTSTVNDLECVFMRILCYQYTLRLVALDSSMGGKNSIVWATVSRHFRCPILGTVAAILKLL